MFVTESIKVFFLSLLFLVQSPLFASDIAILNNQVHEQEASPGEVYHGTIYLENTGARPAHVKLKKTDALFSPGSSGHHEQAGTASRSNAAWIELSRDELVILPRHVEDVNYAVRVPSMLLLSGSFWSNIHVEPVASTEIDGDDGRAIDILVVTNAGDAGLSRIELVESYPVTTGKNAVIEVILRNSGQRLIKPSLWVDLYTTENEFMTRFHADPMSIFPGSTVTSKIVLSGLKLGRYKGIVVGKYSGQRIMTNLEHTVTVVEHISPFVVSLNRSKELMVSQLIGPQIADKQLSSRPSQQIETFNAVHHKIKQQRRAAMNQWAAKGAPGSTLQAEEEDVLARAPAEAAFVDGTEGSAANHMAEATRVAGQQLLHITPGQHEQDTPKPSTRGKAGERYTVQKGDWLSKIALKFYGDMMKYPVIVSANRGLIRDPDLIFPGQALEIPALEGQTKVIAATNGRRDADSDFVLSGKDLPERAGGRMEAKDDIMLKTASRDREQQTGDYFFSLTRMTFVPSSSNSYLISSMSDDRMNIPRPLSLSRFSGASGSLTCSGLKPRPSSLMVTSNLVA